VRYKAFQSRFRAHPVITSYTTSLVDGVGEPLVLTCRWPEGIVPKASVVFCHGLGASARQYEELSRAWAKFGYFVVHPAFSDSIGAVAAAEEELGLDPEAGDLENWMEIPNVRERMFEILHTPSYWLERTEIVSRVLDGMDAIMASTCGNPTQPIPMSIAGHSFGAYTSQLFAGAEIDVPGRNTCRFRDDRLKAAILLSTQGRDQQGLRDGSWDAMTGPVLNVTGTLDRGAKNQDWVWKSEPYELAPPGGKYLAVIDGADHYLGGMTLADPKAGLPDQRDAVSQLTLAFLDAYAMDDEHAMSWLSAISDQIGNCSLLFKRK